MAIGKAGDGGQAFPCEETIGDNSKHLVKGMSLRDYLAAKAMQSIVVASRHIEMEPGPAMAAVSRVAYEIADAMLAERAK